MNTGRIEVRCTAEDRERFERVAEEQGDRSVSAWALRMLRLAATTETKKRAKR